VAFLHREDMRNRACGRAVDMLIHCDKLPGREVGMMPCHKRKKKGSGVVQGMKGRDRTTVQAHGRDGKGLS